MLLRRRARRRNLLGPLLVVLVAVLITACGGGLASTSGPTIAAESSAPSASPSAASPAAMTPGPTNSALPLTIPRPTDIPTDGTCEEEHTCLGLLAAGPHHTSVFSPAFAFSMPEAGWENLADSGGTFDLLPIAEPGDLILVLRRPRATEPDGTLDSSGGSTVESLTTWLAANTSLTVSAPEPISVGGLDGSRVDVSVAPNATNHPSDCPVPVCVGIFRGKDPSTKTTWVWDWGVGSLEKQRLYLLSGNEDVILIVVDSFDGTTFDSVTKAANDILATFKFDQP
jgi:hypothetical protein